jgi:hypothetical protein
MDVLQVVIGICQIALMIVFGLKQMSAASAGTVIPTAVSPSGVPIGTFRRYWPLVAMGLLVAAAWIPYFLRLGEPERVIAVTGWSTSNDGCQVVIDGSKIMRFKDKYILAMVCGFHSPRVDMMQDGLIAVSSPFTIGADPISIEAPFTPTMTKHLNEVVGANPPQPINVWHQAILVPKKEDITKIRKLADVRDIGGKIVANCEPTE